MKKIILHNALLAVALMTTALTSCDSDVFDINANPFKGQTYKNDLSSPISVYIENEPDFSEYAKALRYSETFNALNQSTSGVSFTALVPNNEAMREFYQRRGVDSLQQLTPDYVRSFVLYHTVADSITTDQFVTKSSITNLIGESMNITIDAVNAGEADLGAEGHIVEMGIGAYNGKIYVLSRALTPLVENVYDRVADGMGGVSNIMREAIDASGWSNDLKTVADTIVEDGAKKIVRRYYTFLNVNDATFAKSGINSLADLKSKLGEGDDRGVGVDSLLREYVSYHILQNFYSTSDFGTAEGDATRLLGTAAKNQTMMLAIKGEAASLAEKFVFNNTAESARFVADGSDIRATNGYFHSLDSWLPVWEPEQTEVLWDLADYPEIRSIVGAELYQPAEPVSKEEAVRLSSASCFTYEMGEAGSSNTSYGAIDYLTSKSYRTIGADAGISVANNNDRLVFNLGYMGWVSMKTPTLVRGKYRVEISIGYLSTQAFMRNQTDGNGGLLKISFDDREDASVFSTPYTTVPQAYAYGGIWTTELFSEVEFDETSDHDFKMIVMDPAASSNRGFSIQIDCIRFIPIQ